MNEQTNQIEDDDPLTMEKLREAAALVRFLAPPSVVPPNVSGISFGSGVRIVVNPALPEGTVAVSPRLFEMIYSASESKS
jgi:hypothetical protein